MTYIHVQGCAVIIPAYPPGKDVDKLSLQPTMNEGRPIRYLISAPTMRIPTNVSKTVNSYLAMRAVLREGMCVCGWRGGILYLIVASIMVYTCHTVCSHNAANPEDPIRTVLCPGLGTAVGRMPYLRCAVQMRTAFDAVILNNVEAINNPTDLGQCCFAHSQLLKVNTIIILD